MDQLCDRIRTAREQAGLTVNQAAEALGVQRVQVWRLEHKATTISAQRLFDLAALYGTTPEALFFGKDSAPGQERFITRAAEVARLIEEVIQSLGVRPEPDHVAAAHREILTQEMQNPTAPFQATKYRGMLELMFG